MIEIEKVKYVDSALQRIRDMILKDGDTAEDAALIKDALSVELKPFCKYVLCQHYSVSGCGTRNCVRSAKEYHEWIKNTYKEIS